MAMREIRTPLPGTFYRRAAPDRAPYKNDGDSVAPSDVVGLIEVMKSFHEVRAEVSGSAIRFLVDDTDAVMAGQVIAEVEG